MRKINQKIVDSNFLQNIALETYLSGSPANYAVLTDYASMEAYKGNTLNSIFRSMKILSCHPKQVIVLKTTLVACGLRGRSSGLRRRLIDQNQTRNFGAYCAALDAAKGGDRHFERQLLDRGVTADAQMIRMLDAAGNFAHVLKGLTRSYSVDEIAVLRRRGKQTSEMRDKLIKNVMILAAQLFKSHPMVRKLPNWQELPNTFIFRSSLCAYLLALRWISAGGADGAKPETIRNDMIDVNFAAFATYFDGLLSNDSKASRIYEDAKFLLETLLSLSRA